MFRKSFFRSRGGRQLSAFILLWFSTTVFAGAQTVLFANNFESGSNPGWFRTTIGDSTFHDQWSISSTVGIEPGNKYGDFLASVPVLPSSPSVRWWGGYRPIIQSSLNLPPAWEVSFDIRRNLIEPVLVRVVLATNFPNPSLTYTTYVTPASTGWSHVTLESSQFTRSTQFASGTGTFLEIAMSSHDAAGNPLAMDSIGTFDMQLDNVTFTTVPEPSVEAIVLAGALLLCRSRSFGRRR